MGPKSLPLKTLSKEWLLVVLLTTASLCNISKWDRLIMACHTSKRMKEWMDKENKNSDFISHHLDRI